MSLPRKFAENLLTSLKLCSNDIYELFEACSLNNIPRFSDCKSKKINLKSLIRKGNQKEYCMILNNLIFYICTGLTLLKAKDIIYCVV